MEDLQSFWEVTWFGLGYVFFVMSQFWGLGSEWSV
jgi:hypothetical protein